MSKAVSPLHVSHVHMSQVTTCALKATAVHPRMAGESERERERWETVCQESGVSRQECQDTQGHEPCNAVCELCL